MYENLGNFSFEAIRMGLMRAGICVLKAVFISKSVLLFGAEGFPRVSEHFLGISFRLY